MAKKLFGSIPNFPNFKFLNSIRAWMEYPTGVFIFIGNRLVISLKCGFSHMSNNSCKNSLPLLKSLRIGLSFYNFYSKNPYVQAQGYILGQPTAEIDIFALFLIFLLIFFEFGVANHLNFLVKDFQILTIV
jgi:hypothetical protein